MDSGDRVDHADHDGTAAMTAMAIHDSGSNGRRKYIDDGNCHVDDSFFLVFGNYDNDNGHYTLEGHDAHSDTK